jgi:hypothetical protein
MKKIIRVTLEKEIEIELNHDEFFHGMTEKEYLEEFSKTFWDVKSMDDVYKYAAEMVAIHGSGFYEGIGEIVSYYLINNKKYAGSYRELNSDVEVDIYS